MGMQVERVTRRTLYKLLRTYYLILIRSQCGGASRGRQHATALNRNQTADTTIHSHRKRHTVGQIQEIVRKKDVCI